MTKKDFTQKDSKGIDLVGSITEETSADTKDELTGRLTARFNEEEWAYLTEKHWQWRMTYTDIIRDLVREDMKKHPEIMEKADELTGSLHFNPYKK